VLRPLLVMKKIGIRILREEIIIKGCSLSSPIPAIKELFPSVTHFSGCQVKRNEKEQGNTVDLM